MMVRSVNVVAIFLHLLLVACVYSDDNGTGDLASENSISGRSTAVLVELQLSANDKSGEQRTLSYRVVETYPHDIFAFTEGLELTINGTFLESTGLAGASTLREVEVSTGKVIREFRLNSEYFGEGVTVFQREGVDELFWWTWNNHKCFVYNAKTFEILREHTYSTQGWGMTHDNTSLITSDGSNVVYFRDPATFDVTRTIEVKTSDGTLVKNINELELVRGEILANVWLTNKIVRIDPEDGKVLGFIDLTGLRSPKAGSDYAADDVLNGVAYDAERDILWVTGKRWANVFHIDLV